MRPDYPGIERRVHGRVRKSSGDERFFGVHEAMWQARLKAPLEGAQWTGITTQLAAGLLERGEVDAVLTMTWDSADRWRPVPAIVTDPAALDQCRGMRMGYAPLVALVEPALARGLTRLAVIGIPCQVYAIRQLEADFRAQGLTSLTVIGTPCSDNTSTENFQKFLTLLSAHPERITYLEFRADYRVELRFDDGSEREIAFLDLPISELPADFFPLTCRTCVDYTNSLADITVGYMAGRGEQWLVVRNARGQALVDGLGDALVCTEPTSAGKRAGAVKGFIANTRLAAGGLPLRRMPGWVRPIVKFLMPRTGPRGLEFARTRVEMKAAESILHLRTQAPRRLKSMVPAHVWALVAPYGLKPEPGEAVEKIARGPTR